MDAQDEFAAGPIDRNATSWGTIGNSPPTRILRIVFRSFLDRMFKQRPTAPEAVPPDEFPRRPVAGVASSRPEQAPWRKSEISRDEISVGGLTVTASIEFSTSSGLLRVVGESHYQEHLRKARAASPEPEPVFWASLIPEPDNPHDPNAVKIVIEPIGPVG